MKKVLALFVIVFLFSCNSGKNDKELPEENSTNLLLSDYVGVLGNWSMCQTYDGETIKLMNVCPTIVFNSNGTGQVKTSSPEPEEFSWTIKNKKILIKNNTSSNTTFPDTAYSILFNKQINSLNLNIVNSSSVYYLVK